MAYRLPLGAKAGELSGESYSHRLKHRIGRFITSFLFFRIA
jgi:hypothetical protein